jgi:hypothetical protein
VHESSTGIPLYSYLYPKLAKMLCLSYYLICFLFLQQNWRIRGRNRFCLEVGDWSRWWGGGTMSTHVSKYENDKIKGEIKKHTNAIFEIAAHMYVAEDGKKTICVRLHHLPPPYVTQNTDCFLELRSPVNILTLEMP